MAPRRRMRRQASRPSAKVVKPTARRISPTGTGWTRKRASVITPRVPSLPDEQLGEVGPGGRTGARVHRCGRSGRRRARPRGRSPCPRSSRIGSSTGRLPGTPANPPRSRGPSTGASDRGSTRAPPAAPTRRRDRTSRHAGPPAAKSASTAAIPARPQRSRATPPKTGTEPPHTPLRPPAAVTGTPAASHRASTSETCAVSVGRATRAGRAGTAPSAAHPMARGHQSRPASFRSSSRTETPAQASASRRASRSSIPIRVPPSRSVTRSAGASIAVTGVGWVTRRSRRRRRPPAALPGRDRPTGRVRPGSARPGGLFA